MQIYFENYSKNTAFSRELSLVSATKLRFMGSYPDALALRSANTTLVYVPMGNIILPAYKNTSLHDLQKSVALHCTLKKRGREQSSLNGALINGEAASRLMVEG